MFWTNLIKNVCKIFLVLSIIASVIGGIALADSFDSGWVGFGVIMGGIIFSFLSVTVTMMLCEISENIYKLYRNSNNSESSYYSPYSNTAVHFKSTVNDPPPTYGSNYKPSKDISDKNKKASDKNNASVTVSEWVCNCGKRNTNLYCAKCGKKRPDSFVPTQGKWECPECGMTNPNSSRVCKDCGYQK